MVNLFVMMVIINWNFVSAPAETLPNATFNVYIADVVGGSSIHKGIFADRGSKADYDAWGTLIGDDTWSWEGLCPYSIKSTTYTPPSEELKTHFDIRNNASAYGNGPIQISYPSIIFPDYSNQTLAAEDIGINISDASEFGNAIGFCWVPQTLDPKTRFRSHSCIAHYDPIARRPNLHLITGHLVEKILCDDNLTATGVKFTSVQTNHTHIVSANKEWDSFQTRTRSCGVEVLLDAPAVGANFQDHPVTYLSCQSILNTSHGPCTQGTSPDAAFISLSQLTSQSQEIIDQARAQNVSYYLPPIYRNNPALLKGYLAQRDIILDHFSRADAAVKEIPVGTTGPTQTDAEIFAALISARAIGPSFAHPSGTRALGRGNWEVVWEKICWCMGCGE
ncbi:hypothetical protein BPOR_0334g00060 [Botrytis porri]|uniref:Glucose-methanol-choline oxidoreductase N-terminal domain-containing protein n=1 Tax=Botrytis porri TaxID=87229 RepID=A0A4Z1KP69_9HELO|nr:hypothetical protein BPOR_0334g00060 [Botrytis porri]